MFSWWILHDCSLEVVLILFRVKNEVHLSTKGTYSTIFYTLIWRWFTTYAKVGVGLQTCIFRTPQRRSSVTDHTDRSCVLELPRNDLEIFAIGHVVASLHGYQDSGGDFQLELRTRLRPVKPRILLMSK